MLKDMSLPFISITPGEKIGSATKVVLTTKRERGLIDYDRALCLEDLGEDLNVAKERILSYLYGGGKVPLVVGIDPGERIGVAAYYQRREVEGGVFNSPEDAVQRVSRLIENASQGRAVVRIGIGDRGLAERIAESLFKISKGSAVIELVDERGTSSLSKTKPNKRGIRDQRSARLIALRRGKRYLPSS